MSGPVFFCSIQNLTGTNYYNIFLLVFGTTSHSIAIQTEIRDSKNPVRGGGGSILVVSLFQIIGSYLHDNERETGDNGDGNVLYSCLVWDECMFENDNADAAINCEGRAARE